MLLQPSEWGKTHMSNLNSSLDYRTALNVTTDAMAVVDVATDGWPIRAVNDPFESAFGHEEAAIRGDPLTDVLGFDSGPLFGATADGSAREGYVHLAAVGGERFLRVCPTDDARAAFVAIEYSPNRDPSSSALRSLEPLSALAELVLADDEATVRGDTAEVLMATFGCDAVVVHLGDGERLVNVAEPIGVSRVAERTRPAIERDVRDERNDETWGTVAHVPVGDLGYVQVAAHDASALDATAVSRLEAIGEFLEIVFEAVGERRSLRTEREELAMLNQILRHSVLNGLNLIRARLDMVESDVSETNRDHYETAYARVDDLIDRTKAIRQMQADEGAADTDPRPLDSLLEERVDRASEKFPEATFSLAGPIPDVAVEVDELAHVCIRNVLRNAVQHAAVDTPAVEVRAAVDEASGTARVAIADNGTGLPDDIDRSVFGQGVSGLDGDGHGVGLFLTKQIVEESYGGAVEAAESDRGGTEITLAFPLAATSE